MDVLELALPDMFATQLQKAVMSEMLWDEDGTRELVIRLRMFDILMRFHFVQFGVFADKELIGKYFKHLPRSTKKILRKYAISCEFPLPLTIKDDL